MAIRGCTNEDVGCHRGTGANATAYFLRRIVEMTDARTDQEHLDVLMVPEPSLDSRPDGIILDRTKPSPLPPIVDAAKTLEQLGACCIAIPCITSQRCFLSFPQLWEFPLSIFCVRPPPT